MVTGPAVRMVDIVLSSSSAPDLFYLGLKLPGVEAGDLPDQLVHVVHIVSGYRDHAGLQEVGGEQLEGLAALDQTPTGLTSDWSPPPMISVFPPASSNNAPSGERLTDLRN